MLTLITTVPVLPYLIKVTPHLKGQDPHITITGSSKSGGAIDTEIPLTYHRNDQVRIGIEFGDQTLVKGIVLFRDKQNNLVVGGYFENKYFSIGMDPNQFRQLILPPAMTTVGVLYGGFTASHRIRLGALWLVGFEPPKLGEKFVQAQVGLSRRVLNDTVDRGVKQSLSKEYPTLKDEGVHSLFCGFIFTKDGRTKLAIGRQDAIIDITNEIGFPDNIEMMKDLTTAEEVLQQVTKPKAAVKATQVTSGITFPHRNGSDWVSPIISAKVIDKLVNYATEIHHLDVVCKMITYQKMDKRKSAGRYAIQNFGEYGRYLVDLNTMRNLSSIAGTSPTLRMRGDGYELLYLNTDKIAIFIRRRNAGPQVGVTDMESQPVLKPNPRIARHIEPTVIPVSTPEPAVIEDVDPMTDCHLQYNLEACVGLKDEEVVNEPTNTEVHPDVNQETASEELLEEDSTPFPPMGANIGNTKGSAAGYIMEHMLMNANIPTDYPFKPAKDPDASDEANSSKRPVRVQGESESRLFNHSIEIEASRVNWDWLKEIIDSPQIGKTLMIPLNKVPLLSKDQVIFELPEPYGSRVLWTDITDVMNAAGYDFMPYSFRTYMNMSIYQFDTRTYATEMHIRLDDNLDISPKRTKETLPSRLVSLVNESKEYGFAPGEILGIVSSTLYK